jgi:hypothetical protein
MQDPSLNGPAAELHRIERAIVLQAVRADHHRRCSRLELELELADASPAALTTALARLADAGVVELGAQWIRASRATVRIDELDLIAI